MTGVIENTSDTPPKDNELPAVENSEEQDPEEKKKLARLQKRLATTLTESVTGDSSDEATKRKRLRSSVGGDQETPKLIMRISKGKVTENTGSEDEETIRKLRKRKEDGEVDEDEEKRQRLSIDSDEKGKTPKKDVKNKKKDENEEAPKTSDIAHFNENEQFCWTCHRPEATVTCATCPRTFHSRCVTKTPQDLCPECSASLVAESENRGHSSKRLKLDHLCKLLNFTLDRMKNVPDSEVFWNAVDPNEEPLYYKYIKNPMDLTLLGENIEKRLYGSTVAFLADAKWILHNSIIFNSTKAMLTSTARALLKVCKQELEEIEKCSDCYLNAHTKPDWFIQVCQRPHILIWARLKGFPFWPAKALTVNLKSQMVDARFFGAHDKAWVPVRDCYLLSKNSPPSGCKKRGGDLDGAFAEMNEHIEKIKEVFGGFVFASDKLPFLPENEDEQLQTMMPGWKPQTKPSGKTIKPRSSGVVTLQGEEISPEDRVVEDLERMAAAELAGHQNDTIADDTSADGIEVSEGRTPEHGYSAPKSGDNTVAETQGKEKTNSGKEIATVSKKTPVVNLERIKSKAINSKESINKKNVSAEKTPIGKTKRTSRISRNNDKSVEVVEDLDNNGKQKEKSTADKDDAADKEGSELSRTESAPLSETDSGIGETATVDTGSTSDVADSQPVEVKQENFDQYLDEENQSDVMPLPSTLPADVNVESNQPMLTIYDPNLGGRPQRERSASTEAKKTKGDGSMLISKEVSVHILSENSKIKTISTTPKRNKQLSKVRKPTPIQPPRSENSVTISTSSNNVTAKGNKTGINVISVDTSNTDEQRILLKSLCLEDKRLKKNTKEVPGQPSTQSPPVSSASTSNNAKPGKDNASKQNVPVAMATMPALHNSLNTPLYLPPNAFVQNPNIALTQNSLGQISLVQIPSGIHPNFTVNLGNDPINVSNSYTTLFNPNAPPPLSPFTTTSNGPSPGVLITPNSTAATPTNGKADRPRQSLISVKTPASLGAPTPVDSLTAEVQKYSSKIVETVSEAVVSILTKMSEDGVPQARVGVLSADIEKMNIQHQKAIADLKKHYERRLIDQRTQLERESQKALADKQAEMEKRIEDTKTKQWCALCRKEALFYCCWNTSYCNYPCQLEHWPQHMPSCSQLNHPMPNSGNIQTKRKLGGSNNLPVIRQEQSSSFQSNSLNSFQNIPLSTYSGPNSKKK